MTKPSFSMSEELKEFEELLQTNEVYRDVLGKWGAEITRNIIKKMLASQREEVVEEIRMIVAGNQVVDINSSPLAVLDKSIKELSPNRRKLTNKNKNDMKII